jgi:hypothetical protein
MHPVNAPRVGAHGLVAGVALLRALFPTQEARAPGQPAGMQAETAGGVQPAGASGLPGARRRQLPNALLQPSASRGPKMEALRMAGQALLRASLKGIDNFLALHSPDPHSGSVPVPDAAQDSGAADGKQGLSSFKESLKALALSIGREIVNEGIETMQEFLVQTNTGDDVSRAMENLGVGRDEIKAAEKSAQQAAVLRVLLDESRSAIEAAASSAKFMQSVGI